MKRFEFELIEVAGDEMAFAFLDVRDGAKTVVLHFENVVWAVEGLLGHTWAYWVDAGEHN